MSSEVVDIPDLAGTTVANARCRLTRLLAHCIPRAIRMARSSSEGSNPPGPGPPR